ncbi:precorrin-2 dehydrogenase [Abditibacterium utsteinense]|uniref:precorrin-2 dehydrogenase n=1 Tax=Abditibacterium utsteinense TaxID=1960156 RepID=A0A2S8SRQ0_9BACT|nr:bifunctional precorrin-2 dehydrogenase/sirohydrochlorin ferrochelatase [Abditibacterium utsteinense]PQV63484.1 precorrin-2 dehydrogenase [Abditibacterium utsteinense]
MTLLPVALNLENRAILIVGGGSVAARKAAVFIEAGARVTVVAPDLQVGFPGVEFHKKSYESSDISDFFLICACTDSKEVNAQVGRDARSQKIICNIVDDPQSSDFHTAATIRRGEIAIGISTGAVSPVLSRYIKAEIEECVGQEFEMLLEIAGSYHIETKMRGAFWRQVLASEILPCLRAGEREKAVQKLEFVVKSLAQS